VVDAFDAMTTDRPYRLALDAREARTRLAAGAGTQFDPSIVEALLSLSPRVLAPKVN
jgi:HD-GYP domain-containing protein (c-di-GMP phosphodiesterase class II)